MASKSWICKYIIPWDNAKLFSKYCINSFSHLLTCGSIRTSYFLKKLVGVKCHFILTKICIFKIINKVKLFIFVLALEVSFSVKYPLCDTEIAFMFNVSSVLLVFILICTKLKELQIKIF